MKLFDRNWQLKTNESLQCLLRCCAIGTGAAKYPLPNIRSFVGSLVGTGAAKKKTLLSHGAARQ